MKNSLRLLLVSLCISGSVFSAYAEDFRIGLVNAERVLRESNLSKQADAKMQLEFSKREKDINDLGSSLKSAIEKFEREAPTLSESARLVRQKQLGEQDREFQRKRREYQEEITARRNEEMQSIIDRANKVIKQIGESEKYDAILQEAVYINPKHDITDKVLKVINATK
jgi:outer membrane protein